jgi:hypothetical protein
VVVGVSFSSRHASNLGLDPVAALRQVLALGFRMVRLSAVWDQVAAEGYQPLDRVLAAAESAGVPVLLTVGMKAMRWPEFYFPPDLQPDEVGERVVEFVVETVRRYRDGGGVAAWQVENEPFNRSGPGQAMVAGEVLRREVAAVRELDPRPVVLNCFWHFNRLLDWTSRPWPWRRVEPRLLDLLGEGDVLGFDFYQAIGHASGRLRQGSHARSSWIQEAAGLRTWAESRGQEAWVIEAQAEPWHNEPVFGPEQMSTIFEGLVRAGFGTVLLWGCEHWLHREARGDPSWLQAVESLLATV